MLAEILTDPVALLTAGLLGLTGAVAVLFKTGQADARKALAEAHTREERTALERDKAMAALIELAKSNVLVAERLDAIETRLSIGPRAERV